MISCCIENEYGFNERLMKIGLSYAQSRLLKLLYNNGGMTQADLCKELGWIKVPLQKA